MTRIAVSCVPLVGVLSAFCLWLAAVASAAGQDTAQLQAELDKSRAVIQQLQADLEKSRAVIQQLQAERAAVQEEMAKLRAVGQDQVAQLRAELEQTRAVNKQLQADLTRLQQLMVRAADKSPGVKPPPKPEDLPPKVDGVIRAIQGEMIEISLGSDDGLKKGHCLDIYRVVDGQGIYVGRMELIKTAATESVGRMTMKQKEPQKGDRVVTRM